MSRRPARSPGSIAVYLARLPKPPCEALGRCEFFGRCKTELLSCDAFEQFVVVGNLCARYDGDLPTARKYAKLFLVDPLDDLRSAESRLAARRRLSALCHTLVDANEVLP